MFADAGIDDIRLPYPVNPSTRRALLALMDRAAISIIVDHLDVARGWSEAMQRAGRTLDVLVKVDVGFHRCGIDPDGDALGFVQRVAALPGLRLRGLLSHAGHGYHAASEDELRAIARAGGGDAHGAARRARRRPASRSRRSRSARRRRCASAPASTGSPSCGRATTSTSIARRSRSAPRRSTTAR